MKRIQFISIVIICLVLIACGRTRESEFYLLSPLLPKNNQTAMYHNVHIGIDEITSPAYMDKPQLMLHCTPYRLVLQEHAQWAESLDKNIARVIKTNLANFLPGAIIENAPWGTPFKPNYHLQIDLSQLDLDLRGSVLLRGTFIIYHDDKLFKMGKIDYRTSVQKANIGALVVGLNHQLNRLSRDIAKTFFGLRLGRK